MAPPAKAGRKPTGLAKRAGTPKRRPAPLPAGSRPFHTLGEAEKEAVWESFNDPVDPARLRPLTPAERDRFEAARGGRRPAKPGRPPAAGRATVRSVQVSVNTTLLAEADRYIKAHGMTRTELVAVGLRLAMDAGTTAAQANS